MARSANRIRSLQRTCEMVDKLAFQPGSRGVQTLTPTTATHPVRSAESRKTHQEWLEERFHLAVQKEFTRLGIK
jgi:hypothetical protein